MKLDDAISQERLEEVKNAAREKVGFTDSSQTFSADWTDISGKTCGHNDCNWTVPEQLHRIQTRSHLDNSRHASLLEHLRDMHDGKFPFEVEEQ